jgi:hypothetical protein
MPDVELKRLRKLRERAQTLLTSLKSDLTRFKHDTEENGFRRKPDSESDPNDVNITTTCSCLMALALSGKLPDFYGKESWLKTVGSIFQNVMTKPWMSSGLSENNAFTTALVIRLFGFLREADAVDGSAAGKYSRLWEARLKINPIFAKRLALGTEPFPRFLFELLPLGLQEKLKTVDQSLPDSIAKDIAVEMNRLIASSTFYSEDRFDKRRLAPETVQMIEGPKNAYSLAHLNRVLLHEHFRDELAPLQEKSLQTIAEDISSDKSNFKINNYPPAAAVVYWFVDGITRAGIGLDETNWDALCEFAVDEFDRQRSRFDARHAAMMDPVAMAMAACLCARLRFISNDLQLGTTKKHYATLPSLTELESAVAALFDEQTRSGIWPKYFPLFHYQEAGSNFCFTFELLEAVLVEFGRSQNHLINKEAVIAGLERAVSYCDQNRLQCSEDEALKNPRKVKYQGWNSGGELETLRKGLPESWATAVVHMFLFELIEVLSRHIQERILITYSARIPDTKWNTVDDLLDIDLWLDGTNMGLKRILHESILSTFTLFHGAEAESLRKKPVKEEPLSALLFGPPGTSKTQVAKAVARDLDWPLIEIDPATFLQEGFQNLYVQAEKIFEDVMDLSGVVVLFDEMDALVQKRDGDKAIDTESRFLTTYMLPKLAKLHDRGQIVFLMATNFQATFDDAIKRAGRFDFLLCMGPPTLEDKCRSIYRFYDLKGDEVKLTEGVGEKILSLAQTDEWIWAQLSLYTFGEFKSFLAGLGSSNEIAGVVANMTVGKLKEAVERDSATVGLKFSDLARLKRRGSKKPLRLADIDRIPLSVERAIKLKLDTNTPAVKYVIDRHQSRRQCPKPKLGTKG